MYASCYYSFLFTIPSTGIRSRRHSLVKIYFSFYGPFLGPTCSCLRLQLRFPNVCNTLSQPTNTAAAIHTASVYICGPFSSPGITPLPSYLSSFYWPIALFFIITNHSAWRHHHTHTLKLYIHTSILLQNGGVLTTCCCCYCSCCCLPNSTVAPTQHVSFSKTFFFSKFSNILFFKIFWGPFPLPLGFCPSFSNSPTPATYPTFFTPTFELHSHFFLHGTAKRLN